MESRNYSIASPPAKVIVTEHHVGVYASKKDGHMVKVEHPRGLLKGIPVSPSIA